MAINLGWISFGLNPDTRKLDEARKKARELGQEIDNVSAKTANSLARLSNIATLVSGPLGGVAARVQTLASLAGHFGVATAGFVAGAAAATYAAVKLGGAAIEASKQMQRLEMTLGAVSGGLSLTGRQLDYVREVADRSGRSILDVGSAYVRLAAASKGTNLEGDRIKRVFELVTQTGAKLGLTGDEVAGTLRALEQIMSKGTVQAEELRGQLGDRLPGAFNIMAEAIGVSTKELNKMMQQGQITSDALVPFAETLAKKYGVDLTQAIQTTTSAEGRLSNAWNASLVALDKATGLSVAYTNTLNLLSNILDGITYILTPYRLGLEKSGHAIEVNRKALQEAAGASRGFRQELQMQIMVQRNAARAALTEASAQLKAAQAKQQALYDAADAMDKSGDQGMLGVVNLLGQAFFNEQYNSVDDATKKLDGLKIQLKALDDQLLSIDNMRKSLNETDSEPLTIIKDPEATASSLAKISKALRESGQAIAEVQAQYDILGMSPTQQKFAEMQQKINEQVSVFKDKLVDAGVPAAMITQRVQAYTAALTALEEKQYQLEYLPNFWTAMSEAFSGTLQSASDKLIDTWIEGGDTLKALADIGKMVVSELIKSFATLAVVNPIKNILSNLFGGGSLMPTFNPLSFLGGGGGNSLSSWTDVGAGHFAGGGSFEIPGGGSGRGMDSQLVQFWGSPGETVSISKRGQGSGRGDQYYEGNTYNIDARDSSAGVEERIIAAIKAYDATGVVRFQRDSLKARHYRKHGGTT